MASRSGAGPRRLSLSVRKIVLGLVLLGLVAGGSVFVYYYVRFARLIDARLSGDVFANTSQVYAAPTEVRVGEPAALATLAARLRRAGYAEGDTGSSIGTYRLVAERLVIHPGPRSFFQGDLMPQGPAALSFRNGQIASITSLDRPVNLDSYWLEPEVVTTLFGQNREKRRLVRYQDLPPVLVKAVLAVEDHRFFSHHGVNVYRILAVAITDLRAEEYVQGGSTLTMQLARNFFLTRRKTMRRKMAEIFLALLLEQRLSKEQIFELYSNQVYLGQRGSFSIYGFGEAANAYFNKDVGSLTLSEAAFLAGLIRAPSLYSPYKYETRALERRNFVLRRMLETDFITAAEAEKASGAPLGIAHQNVEETQAPFFVDMVKDQLLAQFSEHELLSQSYRVYTTLDLDLQRAASEAVRAGMVEVDQQVKKQEQRTKRPKNAPPPDPNQPQVALVVLDPHTGVLRALVGGRDYGVSQLNHILARRQPGSSFKPFVYAAALGNAVDSSQPVITPATQLVDEPTTFQFGDQPYEPENYKQEYHGLVSVREALTHSLNVATVQLADMVGFEKVRSLAVDAGINRDIQPTPALALGAYVATPLEIAGAYTVFANGGQYASPQFILAVNDSAGHTLWRSSAVTRRVLDPRVAYLMVSLLESVMNNGTAAGVRGRGFTLPAAGKTGTSHDGWFAGFTSNLLSVVWVGYDDDRELRLAGASSALPIWAEFMKRATQLSGYANVQPFDAPLGIVSLPIDPQTNLVASTESPTNRNEIFIEGSEPRAESSGGGIKGILGRIFHPAESAPAVPAATPAAAAAPPAAPPQPQAGDPQPVPGEEQVPPEPKKGGVVRKFLNIFKGGSSKPKTPPPQPPPPPKKPDS
jgi:penicillin-binding protein 1B